jgi:hypothetical protein
MFAYNRTEEKVLMHLAKTKCMHITASMKKEIGDSDSAQVRKEVPVPKNEMPWLLLVFPLQLGSKLCKVIQFRKN